MVASLLLHMCVSKHKMAVCKGVMPRPMLESLMRSFLFCIKKTHDTAGWLAHVQQTTAGNFMMMKGLLYSIGVHSIPQQAVRGCKSAAIRAHKRHYFAAGV